MLIEPVDSQWFGLLLKISRPYGKIVRFKLKLAVPTLLAKWGGRAFRVGFFLLFKPKTNHNTFLFNLPNLPSQFGCSKRNHLKTNLTRPPYIPKKKRCLDHGVVGYCQSYGLE